MWMLWLVAPWLLFATQVTREVCSCRLASSVPVVTEPRTCSVVLGTTLSASTNWTVLGGLESTMHSHFIFVIATSRRQEELAWNSGASGKAKGKTILQVWLVWDTVFYDACVCRWTYTTHSVGRDLICCVPPCYWRYRTLHCDVWRHSAAQTRVLCAVGLPGHHTTCSCWPLGERHWSSSSALCLLPSRLARTWPLRFPEHLLIHFFLSENIYELCCRFYSSCSAPPKWE